MPPTLSTSWDDSASSVEIDDYGDVFCTTLSSFDAFWSPVGLFWLPGDAEYKGFEAGQREPWPPKEVSVGFGSDLGPCVPQGVRKYIPRNENGSNFEAF